MVCGLRLKLFSGKKDITKYAPFAGNVCIYGYWKLPVVPAHFATLEIPVSVFPECIFMSVCVCVLVGLCAICLGSLEKARVKSSCP